MRPVAARIANLLPACVFSVTTSQPAAFGVAPAFPPATTVASAPSNPNQSLFFEAGAEDCPACATFIGDYNGLAVGTDHQVHSVWTDMRRQYFTTGLYLQDAFYARYPTPPAPPAP